MLIVSPFTFHVYLQPLYLSFNACWEEKPAAPLTPGQRPRTRERTRGVESLFRHKREKERQHEILQERPRLTENEGCFVRPVHDCKVQGYIRDESFCVQEGLKESIISSLPEASSLDTN